MFGSQLKEIDLKLNKIEDAISDIKAGKVVIVVDDEDRENEGDFICAAECATPEIINFMATHGRGLICTPIEEKRADELGLDMMVNRNTAIHETAFTVSIDLIGQGCTTGISAHDRAKGIQALIDPKTKASDFARPGHIFPLRAKSGGVLRRTGHTEAAIDLARLAGYYPAGVLVEILNEDGSMARLPQLKKIATTHDLKLISIKDLIAYRMKHESIIEKESEVSLDTKYGPFQVHVYKQKTTGDSHLAITKGIVGSDEGTLVRVHSNTETGDILGFLFGDYGSSIQKSLQYIAGQEAGVFLYMRHSEKDKSISKKLTDMAETKSQKFYASNPQKDYGVGAQILRDLGITKIKLLTNRPRRRVGLLGYGLEIIENIPLT